MVFDKTQAVNRINAFLQRWAVQLRDINDRASSIFEVFSVIIVTLGFERNKFTVTARNLRNGLFIAKRSVWGDPNNYSFFVAERGGRIYEIRQNQNIHGCHQGFYYINEDVVAMEQNSLKGTIVPYNQVLFFASCKHLSCFPSIIADFVGEVHELQYTRLQPGSHQIPPALLLTTGAITTGGRNIVNSLQTLRRYNVRIFGSFIPSQTNNSITRFLATWQI